MAMQNYSKPNAYDILLSKKKKPLLPTKFRSRRITSSLMKKCPIKRSQTYLDLGQKDFDERTICSLCGMLYLKSQEDDKSAHDKFCEKSQRLVHIGSWDKARTIHSYEKGKIIAVRPGDPTFYFSKVKELKLRIDEEIGMIKDIDISVYYHYLYISKSSILGYICIEDISNAAAVINNKAVIETKDDLREAKLGIRQMWVEKQSRCHKIATQLLDTIRANHIYGYCVPRELVAFTQLTELGTEFAQKYVSPHQILIYDMTSNA